MRKNKIWERIFLGMFLLVLGFSQAGCGKKESISLDEMTGETQTEQENTEKNAKEQEPKQEEPKQEEPKQEEREENEGEDNSVPERLSVYVCGAVNAPGVYEFSAGSRLYQAIEAAGGMREDADKNYLNLARELADGEKLQVPTEEEVLLGAFGAERTETAEKASSDKNPEKDSETAGSSGLVNINTADETLLMTLPGIGESKAKSIIAYRTDKGSFKKIEDIMNIPGIKQAVYDKMKDRICVN